MPMNNLAHLSQCFLFYRSLHWQSLSQVTNVAKTALKNMAYKSLTCLPLTRLHVNVQIQNDEGLSMM